MVNVPPPRLPTNKKEFFIATAVFVGIILVGSILLPLGKMQNKDNFKYSFDAEEIANNAREDYEHIRDEYKDKMYETDGISLDVTEEDVRRDIIQTYIAAHINQKTSRMEIKSAEEILEQVADERLEREVIKAYAEEAYGIILNEEDILRSLENRLDRLKEDKQKYEFYKTISEELNITIEEYYRIWEYPAEEASRLMGEIHLEIREELPRKKDESDADYQNRIINYYNEGLNKFEK